MSRLNNDFVPREPLTIGDVLDAGNQLMEEGVFLHDDVRSEEFLEESLARFEDMMRDVEPETIRAYGMPWPNHGPVVVDLDRR